MKKNLLLALSPLVILVVLFWSDTFHYLIPDIAENGTEAAAVATATSPAITLTSNRQSTYTTPAPLPDISEQIVSNALSLIGSPYVYAGTSPNGFDCSGFITYVYDQAGINLPHSSAMQANEGAYVAKEEARTGDLVIFTGTDADKREPGHVGIVLSSPGDTIEFVHSSSNGGVKISKVEGTRYDVRFLEVRRVL
ncbi:C40 family peptidase [uncultured Pontibacter sp.]|uniref:C40 family peptidase n=1 Tax=uncultured Pontibacter sp. TaxID=453356 RepID=UPI00261B6664|nr:C40 family peptidase [uncultured Pontibacter sp.]